MLFACDQKIEHLNDDFYARASQPRMPSRATCPDAASRASSASSRASESRGAVRRTTRLNYLVKDELQDAIS